MNDRLRPTATGSPTRLFVVSSGVIFVGETLVMLLLDALPSFPGWLEALLDSALLSILVFPLLFFCIFRPLRRQIAECRRAEEALLASKKQLEQHAAALASSNRALEEINQLAESATRAKSEFLANMSHEIRTPMTAILGYADVVQETAKCCPKCPDHLQCELRSTVHEAISRIRSSGNHLLGLINNILDLSKVEAGKLQIESTRCSPFELVAEVASLMRVRAEEKQLSLDVQFAGPLPETVLTDPLRLRQVLINLVGNAITFTEKGEVRITARLAHESDSWRLCFQVTDTGIGMNEEQVRRLFQAFSQVDSSAARRFGGTGLGLCLSKGLIKAMHGSIEVRSVPGKGSTFTIAIDPGPLDGVPMIQHGRESVIQRPPNAASAEAPQTVLNCRVLLAEDGQDNQRLISFLLKKAGAEVTTVENGQRAMEAAMVQSEAGCPFDVILMDMQMPVMDGYQTTRTLRERGYGGPIVALTAHAMIEDRQKCLDAGCDDYTTKPIDRQMLLDVVARWANSSMDAALATSSSGAERVV